ncbi:MAG: leucine-rich repeat protein [Clostridiales Family XIII bacterium]|jgi:hypothetical protein|nr:leucine-rich repeat protein [Clostridiales Family XIII bacterium]
MKNIVAKKGRQARQKKLAPVVAVIMALTLWTVLPAQASADEEGPSAVSVNEDSASAITLPEGEDEPVATRAGDTGDEPVAAGAEMQTSVSGSGTEKDTSVTALGAVRAADAEMDGVYTNTAGFKYTVSGNEATITGYEGTDGAITIPDFVAGSGTEEIIPVTAIGDRAFQGNASTITSVVIPEGVTSIGDWAFFYYTPLTAVTLPDSLTNIGFAAFQLTSLEEVAIPKNVTSIGNWAFDQCLPLASITVEPENPSYTDDDGILFNKDKTTLMKYPPAKAGTEYSIPSGVTYIDLGAVRSCTNLTEITIPESVTNIGDYAFDRNTNLNSIEIPSGVTTVGNYAFSLCPALTSIEIPANVKTLGYRAFQEDTGLVEVAILGNTEEIGAATFYGCASLSSIRMPKSVTSIGDLAFWKCASLVSVEIPAGVKNIGNNAFRDCDKLAEVMIPEGVENLGNTVFTNCKSLVSIDIPATVKSIGAGIFQNCAVLETVHGMTGITSIGDNAFSSCAKLTDVTIPEGVTSIGARAFNACTSLTSVAIPEGVESIGGSAFYACTSLTSVTIPASVERIGTMAFFNCSKITDLTILNKGDTMIFEASAFPISGKTLNKVWCYDGSVAQTYAGVKAVVMIETIALDEAELNLNIDEDETLSVASYLPTTQTETTTGANIPAAEWTSSNAAAAEVDDNGKVTTKAHGTALITATIKPHSGVVLTATCEVNVAPSGAPATYELTMEHGDIVGESPFAEDATVTVIADAAPAGKVFDKWTGTGGGNFADASKPTTVFTMPGNAATVTATYRYLFDAPNASIDYTNEKLTGLDAGASYSIVADAEIVANADGTYDIDPVWMETTLSVVRTISGADGTVAASEAQSLYIPARPDAPTSTVVKGSNETVVGMNDGRITGVTGAMEYSADGINWTPCTGPEMNLPLGSYAVRYQATDSDFRSDSISVTVAGGAPQTRVLTMQGLTFGAVTEGYVRPAALNLTIRNTGNSTANIADVTISGTAFELGGFGSVVTAGGSIATRTIRPNAGLGAGTYTATVAVAYDDGATATATVRFTVNARTETGGNTNTGGNNTGGDNAVAVPGGTTSAAGTGATGGTTSATTATSASATTDTIADAAASDAVPSGTTGAENAADTDPTSDIGEQETPQAAGDGANADAEAGGPGSGLWIALIAALAVIAIAAVTTVAVRRRRAGRDMN